MKRILIAAALVATTITSPARAADVGVSVSIGQPGFYGQIDVGNMPQPKVIYVQPMVITRGQEDGQPIYLRVPPGHVKHWSKHCREYNACGRRVFFVQENWYNREYAPRYQVQRGGDRQDGRRDERGDEGRGNGNGKGHKNKDHRGRGQD